MRYSQSILEIINTSGEHMTAEQVFFVLKEKYPSVVMATVYNNLNSLYQSEKIRKISMEGQPDRYDRNTRHDHLVCSRCGKLSDIVLSDFTEILEREVGFPVKAYDLRIQYLCPGCREKETSSVQPPNP